MRASLAKPIYLAEPNLAEVPAVAIYAVYGEEIEKK